MTQDNVPELVIQIISNESEEAEKKGRELHMEKMENINPAYEALIALLCKCLPKNAIVKRFLNEKSLNNVLVANALYDAVKNNSTKRQIADRLQEGSPLEEITAIAAVDLAEGKRAKDGKVLLEYRTSELENKFMARALREGNYTIYFQQSDLEQAKKRAPELRADSRAGTFGCLFMAGILALGLGIGGYFLNKKIDWNVSYKWKDSTSTVQLTTQPTTSLITSTQPTSQPSTNQYNH